jgi:hypothetical protein
VQAFRTLIRARRELALLFVALALCARALVPAGYMLAEHGTTLTVEICADSTGKHLSRQITVPSKPGEHAKAEGACPWATTAAPSLAATDPVILALALALILLLGFAPSSPAPCARTPHLRPPSCGPPAIA